MKRLKHATLIFLMASSAVFAAPASEDSIRQLLAVTKTRGTVEGMQTQLRETMHKTVQQAMRGKIPNIEQQEAIDNMENKLVALLNREFAWEILEPSYIRRYQEFFSEEEVAGMLSFYRTPVGQAVVNKMPALMQQLMLEMQEMRQRLGPEVRRIQQEFISELKAAGT